MYINSVENLLVGIEENKKREFLPPFAVELFMKDHRSYCVRNVMRWYENRKTVILEVWDMEMLSSQEKEAIKSSMTSPPLKHSELENVYDQLKSAEVVVRTDDIMY